MGRIDKSRVKRSFGRQAREYDRHIDVQKRVVDRFLEILGASGGGAGRILDMGAGTGTLLSRLSGVYPQGSLFGVDLSPEMGMAARGKMGEAEKARFLAADVEQLPFRKGAFDLVISTSTFQWLNTLDHAFGEACRVLAPGGRFRFALFGENTLFELRNSYRSALASAGRLPQDRTHVFPAAGQVEAALAEAGFKACFVETETCVEWHENVRSLLRSLKNVGAGNAAPGKGLAARGIIGRMIDVYEKAHGTGAGIPATYEVIYAGGEAPSAT